MRDTEVVHEIIRKELVATDSAEAATHVSCICGGVETVVQPDEDIDSMSARHFLVNDIWPFKAPPRSSKWPHNTREDDEEDRRRNI